MFGYPVDLCNWYVEIEAIYVNFGLSDYRFIEVCVYIQNWIEYILEWKLPSQCYNGKLRYWKPKSLFDNAFDMFS